MNTFQKFIFKITPILLFISTLLYAQSEKENIAVIELKGEITESESAALTDKVINEILKTGKYLIVERSQMDQILKEQGFQQTGCTSTECAIEIGQLLGVRKTVFGNIGKVGKIFSISLKMVDIQTGEIAKSTFIEFKGSLENILTKGIIKAVQDLLSPSVSKPTLSTPEQDERDYKKRHTIKITFAIMSAAVGVCSGAACAYYWKEKKNLHDKYLALQAGQQDLMNKYHEDENSAYTKAGIFTGVAGTLIPTSILLFIIKTKKKEQSNVSIDAHIIPDAGAVTVTVNF